MFLLLMLDNAWSQNAGKQQRLYCAAPLNSTNLQQFSCKLGFMLRLLIQNIIFIANQINKVCQAKAF